MEAHACVVTEVGQLIKQWEEEHQSPKYKPVPVLSRLAEIIEAETENYLKMDPDPFDERHPSRADPDSKFGVILKIVFKRDVFMNKVVSDYLRDTYYARQGIAGENVTELNTLACRLLLDLLPGLEVSLVFEPEMEGLLQRLIKWTIDGPEPLQTYATGLLGVAMELPDIAIKHREASARLVPLLLQRLRKLQEDSDFPQHSKVSRPFAHFARSPNKEFKIANGRENGSLIEVSSNKRKIDLRSPSSSPSFEVASDGIGIQGKRPKLDSGISSPPSFVSKSTMTSESSNSSWAELESFVIGNVQMHPPTPVTTQILILRYLTPMGEYQEFLSPVFEYNALELILNCVNVRETKQARLAFEALRYLAALLCHIKFSLEFLQYNGMQCLLDVPRPSIAATGVSICMYYLSYCEEAMERVCLLPKTTIYNLVKYALWLLECSHDSGICHATMFFGLTFQFKMILDEFDAQDGLRKLFNVISTLPIFSNDGPPLNEDSECAARQVVRHVCVAYKRYLEAHLIAKIEQLQRSQMRTPERPGSADSMTFQPCKSSPEEIQQQIEMLFQFMPFRTHWAPVDNFLKLGAITLLLKVIAFAYEWNYSGRAETVRCALDTLAIACVMPKVQMLLCERVDLPEDTLTLGMSIILGAAEGEIVRDSDVQKSALRVLINCVCAPTNRVGGAYARFSSGVVNSPSKKMKVKSSLELIQKVWDCVRANSGIMVLMQLLHVKTPITDADCLRTLACKALVGLARCDNVRQIVSKLPTFQSGQLQNLMRDPILQEKRQEHVAFQRYALELLEGLSGKTTNSNTDVSLANIHRASVVAQTNITFNDKQLMLLIHQHLMAKGCSQTAAILQKEANLGKMANSTSAMCLHPSKFRYTPSTPSSIRSRSFNAMTPNPSLRINLSNAFTEAQAPNLATPTSIKLVRKQNNAVNNITPHSQNSRLQKKISNDPLVKLSATFEESPPAVTLDTIITEYLTNQHALCKNPMATCPQFNLFVPHKCPDPKQRLSTSTNVVMRCARRQMGFESRGMDHRLINSRFRSVQSIRYPNEDGFFTCASFLPGDQSVIVGDYNGEVRIYNIQTGNEEASFAAHETYIFQLEPNRKGDLLLTSSTWRYPLSALWGIKDLDMKQSYDYQDYIEFSKVQQDRVIGTKGEVATVYDVPTGNEIQRFIPLIHNHYTKNKATFSHTDELILTDGVIFDVNSGQIVRKLDKLNQTQNGIFHPNGREIIANMEVWDMRTYHLLKTVQPLNLCNVKFGEVNNAIFAFSMEQEREDDSTFESSFKTIDAIDYSSIATIDVKRNIYDLAINRHNSQIAIVENQGMYYSVQESTVRLYDVGRQREVEDDQDEEEEDLQDDDDEDDDNSEDDSVDLFEDSQAWTNRDGNGEQLPIENNENGEGEEDDADDEEDSLSLGSNDTFTSDSTSNASFLEFLDSSLESMF